jgi:COMPASS component SPP1
MDPDASKDVEMADATAIAAPPHQVGNPFTFTVKFHTLGYEFRLPHQLSICFWMHSLSLLQVCLHRSVFVTALLTLFSLFLQDEQQSATTQALSNSPSESQMEPTLAEPEAPVSNNAPGFKYKYSQASPTPPGVDDTDWNKIYTAADSRMYNKHGKNANNSKKFRESGETRVLALSMLKEKMEKLKKEKEGGTLPTPKPKAPAPKKAAPVKKESSTGSRDATPGGDIMPMSISEKIKSEGRARKASSAGPSSAQGTPAPAPAMKSSPAPPAAKIDKPATKKKGTAAPVKKPTKKTNVQG